jgi:hypothetical protein
MGRIVGPRPQRPRLLPRRRREPLPGLDAAAVCSCYALPIGAPATALLVLNHTNAAPRGFTALCRDLGVQLATTAGPVLATARLREHLQDGLRRVAWIARTDPVTGYGNRRPGTRPLPKLKT